jgi:hypothetical protein
LVVPTWPYQSERAMVSWPRRKSVGQIERDDLASPKPCLASEQHEREHAGIHLSSAIHQPLEVVEVEKLDFRLASLQLREPWCRPDDAPFRGAVEQTGEHREGVVDRSGIELLHGGLEPLF